MYKKFPSDIPLDIKTFLNDKKIDSELYAYFMSISKGEKGQTIVYKKDVPSQSELANILHYRARQTVATHLKYLIKQDYIKEDKDKYILVNPEKYYFQIPLETLCYLIDTVTETVVKVYIYLGVCHKYKSNYEFTIKEICNHLGLNYQNNCTRIRNILDALEKLELISFNILYDEKKMPYFKIIDFKENILLKKS